MPKARFMHAVKALLRNGRPMTARQMAAELECNERTIRRCIDQLRDAEGWPVEGGRDGFHLRERTCAAETPITGPEEIAAIVMAHDALRRIGSSDLAERLRGELARICREAEDLAGVGWARLGETVDGGGKALEKPSLFGLLSLAMIQGQLARIRYRRLQEDTAFPVRIYPFKWLRREGCWYLIASDLERGGLRTYALPRIVAAEIVARPARFVAPVCDDRHDHAFGIWTPGSADPEIMEVVVEISGYWARIARERQWHPSQVVEDRGPELVLVRFQVNELIEVKSWVLRFGGAARVLGPPRLLQMVRDEITAMAAHHARGEWDGPRGSLETRPRQSETANEAD
jgi:proteasome accessory factor B